MKEQDLQAKILKMLKQRGSYVAKIISASKAGVPDILCCYKGSFIGIEVKVGTNKATELQELNLKSIRKAGGFTGVFYSVVEVENFLQDLDTISLDKPNKER